MMRMSASPPSFGWVDQMTGWCSSTVVTVVVPRLAIHSPMARTMTTYITRRSSSSQPTFLKAAEMNAHFHEMTTPKATARIRANAFAIHAFALERETVTTMAIAMRAITNRAWLVVPANRLTLKTSTSNGTMMAKNKKTASLTPLILSFTLLKLLRVLVKYCMTFSVRGMMHGYIPGNCIPVGGGAA